MGKGTILSGGEEGKYNVRIELDHSIIDSEKTRLTDKLVELASDLSTWEDTVNVRQATSNLIYSQLNALIAANPTLEEGGEAFDAINAKVAELSEAESNLKHVERMLASVKAEQVDTQIQLDQLNDLPEYYDKELWCADLSVDLSGEVGLIEVPGELGAVSGSPSYQVNIQPNLLVEGNAEYSEERDGISRLPNGDVPEAIFYNWCLQPGWETWYPRYRLGTITSIDYDLEECDLTLVACTTKPWEIKSGSGTIDTNTYETLESVPIEYNCGAGVFLEGDEVVIEFEEMSINGGVHNWEFPKVIGFSSNPKGCIVHSYFVARNFYPETDGYLEDAIIVTGSNGGFTRSGWEQIRLNLPALTCKTKPDWAMNCSLYSGWGEKPSSPYSGNYTGEMRIVYQYLLGKSTEIPYDHCWEKTHGIFVAGNGDRYIIEVWIYGVTAWQLDTVSNLEYDGWTSLEYLPVPTSTVPDMEDRITLIDSVGMAEFRANLPITKEHGWAFNTNGHEACTIGISSSPDPNIYRGQSHIWNLSITESGNAPASAVISKSESDYLFNNSDTLNSIKWHGSGGCYQSLGLSFSPPGYDDPSGSIRAPVMTFFDGDNQITVYMNYVPRDTRTVDEKPGDAVYGCNSVTYGIPESGANYRKGFEGNLYSVWFEVDGWDRQLATPENNEEYRPAEVEGSWSVTGGLSAGADGIISITNLLEETLTTYQINTPIYAEQLIFAYGERCGFYIFQSKNDTAASTKTVASSRTAYGSGTKIKYYEGCPTFAAKEWTNTPSESNPCGCGEIGDIIGIVVEESSPTETISGYELLPGASYALSGPNRLSGDYAGCTFDLYCFEARGGYDFYNSPCGYINPDSRGTCASRTETTVTEYAPAQDGHIKLNLYVDGVVYNLIDTVYDYTDSFPYTKFIESPSIDGCQWLVVGVEANKRMGYASSNIINPMVDMVEVGGSISGHYPAPNVRQFGFTGFPLPDY